MKKKLLAILLSAAVAGVLPACGSASKSSDTSAKTTQSESQTGTKAESGSTVSADTESKNASDTKASTGTESKSASGAKTSTGTESQTKPAAGSSKQDKTPTAEITGKNFKKIKTGMSYKEVLKIIGKKGKLISTSETNGTKTNAYQWRTGSSGTVVIIFQNNKVMSKTQVGVESSKAKVTPAQYNKVKEGMSYKKTAEILGGEGVVSSTAEVAGQKATVYSWNGTAAGSTCMITFLNGKVYSKSQVGLK
ncbi:MAG: DUF3862 domain-containing protein [Eubacterium sp.]|jgi:hypothetical protein